MTETVAMVFQFEERIEKLFAFKFELQPLAWPHMSFMSVPLNKISTFGSRLKAFTVITVQVRTAIPLEPKMSSPGQEAKSSFDSLNKLCDKDTLLPSSEEDEERQTPKGHRQGTKIILWIAANAFVTAAIIRPKPLFSNQCRNGANHSS